MTDYLPCPLYHVKLKLNMFMTTPTNCEILAIFITLNKTWKWHFVMTSKYTFSSKVDVPSVILNQLYLLLLLLYLFQYLTRKVHHFKLGFFLLFSVSVNTCFAVDPHISYTNLDISLHFQKKYGRMHGSECRFIWNWWCFGNCLSSRYLKQLPTV